MSDAMIAHDAIDRLDAARVEALAGEAVANANLAAVTAQRDELATANTELAADLESANDTIAEQAATIVALEARIAELEAEGPVDPPDPEPVPVRMIVGACPAASGGTGAQVVAKYGAGCAVRTFSNDADGWEVAQRPAGAGIWHHSWKPPLGTPITPAQIQSALANCETGDIVSVWHETPTKYRAGKLTRAQVDQAMTRMAEFHDLITVAVHLGEIAAVRTCFVDAAWMWDDRSGLYPGNPTDPGTAAYWTDVPADLIGIDLDAYANLSKYPAFGPVITNAAAWATAHGYGWTIPELIHPRRRTGSTATSALADTNGSERAAWLTATLQQCDEANPRPVAVMLFDTAWTGRPDQVIPNPSLELSAVRAFMAQQ